MWCDPWFCGAIVVRLFTKNIEEIKAKKMLQVVHVDLGHAVPALVPEVWDYRATANGLRPSGC
jgi:hypothetical protein